MKKRLSIVAVLSFFFSTFVFAEHTIEVCKVSIGEKLSPSLGKFVPIEHLFVKSSAFGNLNFGPVDLELAKMLANQVLPANVTFEEHPAAECVAVHKTNDDVRHAELWSLFEHHYTIAAETTPYNLFNDRGGKNCGMVAAETLEAVRAVATEEELEGFPFPNVNGQDYTERFMRSFRGIISGEFSPQNVGDAFAGLAGAAEGIAREARVEVPLRQALEGSAQVIRAVQPEVARAVDNIGRELSNVRIGNFRFGW